jgi:hypothetical protein
MIEWPFDPAAWWGSGWTPFDPANSGAQDAAMSYR